MRTQEEILAKMKEVEADDMLGFQREVLVYALDFEHSAPFRKEGTTEVSWAQVATLTDNVVTRAARDYADFAWGKVGDHRGISANRSVEKMTMFAWLLGRDEVVAAIEEAGYPQYGAPKLKAACEGLGFPVPDDEELRRMMAGEPCRPGCTSGCGR